MSEFLVFVERHLRNMLRARAFLWSTLAFCALLVIAVVASPPSTPTFVPALWAVAFVLIAWTACVAATAAHALPADRASGRASWLRTLAPPRWKDRIGAACAAMLCVLAVGVVAAVGLGLWAGFGLGDFHVRAHTPLPVIARARIDAAKVEGEPGAPWTLELPAAADPSVARRLELRVRPQLNVRRGRAQLTFEAGGATGDVQVATRGPFVLEVPGTARRVTLRSRTTQVHLRVREAALLGPDRSPAVPIAMLAIWMALLVAAVVPIGLACSRCTSSATAGGLMFSVLLFGLLRRPLLDLVHVLAAADEPSQAVTTLRALGRVVPDLPLFRLASAIADGRQVAFVDAAPWGTVLLFACAGLVLVWLPVRRETMQS